MIMFAEKEKKFRFIHSQQCNAAASLMAVLGLIILRPPFCQ
jgi:hypothetical protein